ncbi:Annexin [Microthyrium microscopicum]|uniref:Annexin n=1 Tax=Microthyrium microscopicum TaxID=703497 RepID=A0A6A6UV42_9PEZI|nr:Annexin [Microthyrium microscopicum]
MEAQPDNQYHTPPGGVQGVQYSAPMVPTFTPYPQTGPSATVQPTRTVVNGYNAPSGAYQYAKPPSQIKYTSQPIRQPPPLIPHTPYATIPRVLDEKKKKQKKSDQFATVEDVVDTQYSTMTIEPGGKPTKKKKDKDVTTLPYPGGNGGFFGGMPPPPSMPPPSRSPFQGGMPPPPPPLPIGHPDTYPISTPGGYPISTPAGFPISTPGGYPIDGPDEYPISAGGRAFEDGARIKDIAPRDISPPKSKSKSHRLSTSQLRPDVRGVSPGGGMRTRMDRLSVSGDRPDVHGVLPPASPLLEAYRGTWQSMPGMPSPMIRAHDDYDDYSDLSPLEPSSPRTSKERVSIGLGKSRTLSISKTNGRASSRQRSLSRRRSKSPKKKTVSMYQAEEDASHIATELTKAKPDFGVLTDILPVLSHDQIMELHTAYKHVAKYQGRGINIAKHIKLKVPSNLRTIAYVTALGRWESEGYWANYWYQSAVAKRELLIEALMGRPNSEVQKIKENFRDKRYGDSLVKCMDKELRVDKFRTAIMWALEARRQDEKESFPREYVEKDVDTWVRALKGRSGGESAMLQICVQRSERHLKECLRLFERREGGNFAKIALQRSENLVGEVIAHILNGVINRPARDAMLLYHALLDLKPRSKSRRSSAESSGADSRDPTPRSSITKLNPFSTENRETREREKEKEKEKQREKEREREDRKDRYELLISRLVRYHWDKVHLRRVKEEYRAKYYNYVEDDVEDWLKPGEFQEFCLEMLTIR